MGKYGISREIPVSWHLSQPAIFLDGQAAYLV
jgi:hypothetical protein